MSRQRVAVVAFSAPPFSAGGVASAHFNLFIALRRAGIEARFFTFGDYDRSNEDNVIRSGTHPWLVQLIRNVNGLFFRFFDKGKRAYELADVLFSFFGARRMSREIADFAPEIIILSDHGAPGLALKKPDSAKIILVSHHNPARFAQHHEMGEYSELDRRWALGLEQRVLKKVNIVVCPSGYMKEWFDRSYRFFGPVHVIPNLIDEDLIDSIPPYDVRAQFGMVPDDILVYMPSAGTRLKGSQYLLEIIRGLTAESGKPIGFYIPGTVMPDLVSEVSRLAPNARLCLAGQIPYAEHIANMKTCSFGVSPSLIENYSMAMLEAVHCGVPIVAFATGGNGDIIHEGKNGFLVPEGHIEALIAKARSLLLEKTLTELKDTTEFYSREKLSSRGTLKAYLELMDLQ